MKNVIDFSVKNSLFVNLLSVFLIIAGILSLFAMRREAFPNVDYDIVLVQSSYMGAPPEEVEKLLTIELEDELKEVDGIDEMVSVSSENISLIILEIDPDERDKTKVVNDIQRAVDRVDTLPDDADDPVVTEIESKNFPVINVSVSGNMREQELQHWARKLELMLLDLPDIARVDRIGWRDREMWVEVDPKKINELHLSLNDIMKALNNQNLNIPGGTLSTAEGDYLVRTIGEFETPEEIENVIVRANDLGNWIRIKDIAKVKDTFEDDNLIEKTFGEQAITLTAVKKERGDIIRLVKQIKEVGAVFKQQAPDAIRVSYFDDFSFYVKRRLNVLVNNGSIGLIFVVLTLLIFLSRTIAVLTAIGIPVAMMVTFFLMHSFGFTINLITMFGLIMVLGMIVDDAIVIAENVYRHIEEGVPPREAAVTGASEVSLAVISTVLTTIVAFIPLLFMSGIMGKFIRAIPFVVIMTLCASLFEAFVILPSHLADFARLSKTGKEKKLHWFEKVKEAYGRSLEWAIYHRYKAIGLFVAITVSAILLYMGTMRFVLFPQGLIEEFYIKFKAPMGTSLEETERRINRVEDFIRKLPPNELENYVTRVGIIREDIDDPEAERGTHLGQVHVFLTPEKTPHRRLADEIIREIKEAAKPLYGLFEEITFEKVRSGPPVGKPVSIRLRGDDLKLMDEAAELFKNKLNAIPGVTDVKDDFDTGKKEVRVDVNTSEATKAGLTIRDISQEVRSAIDGGLATKIKKTDEEIEVLVRYPKAETNRREILDYIRIPNDKENLIPLNKIAAFKEEIGINAIKHLDRKRLINVTANVDEEVITPMQVSRMAAEFYETEIKDKYPSITITFGGEQEETSKSLRDFLRAIFLAVFLIFIILAANFNSIVRPLIVMSAIPCGLAGVVFAFFLHGMPLSFMALLGAIGLSGVVVNNAIVLVDFIQNLRKRGVDRMQSIIQAGQLRLRPICVTTITTLVGLLPVAYSIGGGDPFLRPMALAISWGLAFSSLLTLLMVPALYAAADDAVDWGRRIFQQFKNRAKATV